MSTCKGCGAEIVWIKTKAGKPAPVNIHPVHIVPDPAGSEYGYLEDGSLLRGRKAGMDDEECKTCMQPHFATCQKADTFRRVFQDKKDGREQFTQMSLLD